MAVQVSFQGKDPRETRDYTIDMTPELQPSETITACTCTMTVVTGTDASPSSMLSGSATISSPRITQLITGGINGNTYELTFQCTTNQGETLIGEGRITVSSV